MGIGLGGLGSLAGGFSQSVDPYINQLLQQKQQQQGMGLAGQSIAGAQGLNIPAAPQSPLAGLLSKLGMGSAQPPTQQPAPQQQSPLGSIAPQQAQPPVQQAAPQQGGGGFGDAVKFTLGHEGGLNAADTNGTPSNMGINQAANPDVDVRGLNQQQAVQLYKTRYWDAIGGDQLPAPLQKMAFDTAVIAGPGKAKEFLQASGGDPQKFMAIRQQFQEKLLAADPNKYGKYAETWRKRNADLAGGGQPQGGGQPGAPQGQPPQAGQVQQMSLADIVQSMKRAKPDLNGVELMQAVGHILPIMNAQAQQQYHAVSQQLAAARIGATERGQDLAHGDREAALKERAAEAQAKQANFQLRYDEKKAEFKEKMGMELQKLQAANGRAEKAQHAAAVRAAISAKLRADKLQVDAANVFDEKERANLKKIAEQDAAEATRQLDEALKADRAGAKPEAASERAATPGAVGGYAPKPEEKPAAAPRKWEKGMTFKRADGQVMAYKGTGDHDDIANWEPVNEAPPRAQ